MKRWGFLPVKEADQITNANVKKYAIGFVGRMNGNAGEFTPSEHSLTEIKSAIETDSYLKVSVIKYAQLITKNGYKMTSINEEAVRYVQRRIRQMEFGTGTPFEILLDGIAADIVKYSNVFLAKSRVSDTKQLGVDKAVGILSKKPVGGYFRMDPTTVSIQRNDKGAVDKYQQEVESDTTEFDAADVVHMFVDREAGNSFGTPRMSAALEDVRLLRKIEGQVLNIMYRYAIPLYQVKIGLPQENFMATEKEIRDAQNEIEKMPNDGILITNERTEFKVLGADGEAIDLSEYLKYFENRVFSALNLSQSMMGRSGAKQDADSMEQQVHDQVRYFQRTIEAFIEAAMFNELLMEGGFDPIGTPEDRVTFSFNEISLETKTKMENNTLVQFQGNLITFEEARRNLGYTADDIDEDRLFARMISQRNAIEQIEAKLGNAESIDKRILNGNSSSGEPNGTAKNNNMPTNQYGTTSVKVRESVATEHEFKTDHKNIYTIYKKLCNNIGNRGIAKQKYISLWKDIREELRSYASDAAGRGALAYRVERHLSTKFSTFEIAPIEKLIDESIKKTSNDIYARIQSDKRDGADLMEYRVRFMCDYIEHKAYWYGYCIAARNNNEKRLFVKFHSDDDKKNHKSVINLSKFNLTDIPPFHPYCKCSLKGGR